MRARLLAGLLLGAALAGCDRADMAAQDRSRQWDENRFFADSFVSEADRAASAQLVPELT